MAEEAETCRGVVHVWVPRRAEPPLEGEHITKECECKGMVLEMNGIGRAMRVRPAAANAPDALPTHDLAQWFMDLPPARESLQEGR